MLTYQNNIALVSKNQQRLLLLSSLLQDSLNRLYSFDFDKALQSGLIEQPLDLVVLDCSGVEENEYEELAAARKQEKLIHIPFVYILSAAQESLKRQIYKNPYNKILLDPFDKFMFFSVVSSATQLSYLERRNRLYEDMIEGERSLISHMDQLLEMDNIRQFDNKADLFAHLETKFVRRMELALAVETAVFSIYNKGKNVLTLNIYNEQNAQVQRRHSFFVKDSLVKDILAANYSHIFNGSQLSEPFVQELEEALGIKIFSLLCVPFSVFHEPEAAIFLVNKIYRDEFSENDLAFSLIMAHKINYHLENISLRKEPAESILSATDQKMLQELELFKDVLDSVDFGSVVFNEKFEIRYLNLAALSILNFASKKKSPKFLQDLFSKDEFASIEKAFHEDKFPVVRKELQLQHSKIPHFYIGYSIYPLRGAKDRGRYIFVFSEISQTKRIQAEIIRMDRMASLGALSSGIAHEIRNPLAGIKAMAQTLEEEMEKDSIQVEYVERILRQVNRLDILLKSFFTYASPVRPDPSSFHIHKIIHEIIPLVNRKLSERKIKIVENYAPDLAHVFVDPNQIEQVFLNMFLNAIDAMKDGGTLSISAKNAFGLPLPVLDRRKPAPGLLSDSYIEIKVKDNGEGVSAEACERIFTPFYTTKSNGTGLGLSIVYQIIKEHGGRIDVQSTPGQGTEFTILLPAMENNAATLAKKDNVK